ncbi:hypothetical protein, partial [Streptomyces neyagawaensis]|uniref:hypothetical protein n=1 Tax=Streptomyces neyagawaensis TaxID=42238 RepID=UPI0019816183
RESRRHRSLRQLGAMGQGAADRGTWASWRHGGLRQLRARAAALRTAGAGRAGGTMVCGNWESGRS